MLCVCVVQQIRMMLYSVPSTANPCVRKHDSPLRRHHGLTHPHLSPAGRPISDFVDALRPAGAGDPGRPSANGAGWPSLNPSGLPADPALRAAAMETNREELAFMLLQLVKRWGYAA
jgi:hypothetical protein